MLNILNMTFKIDITYGINSFIYLLRNTIGLKHLFKETLIAKDGFKKVIRFFVLLFKFIKKILFRFSYYFIIYTSIESIFKGYTKEAYTHILIMFTLIGMIINYNILSIDKRKYFCVLLFKMDAKKYILVHYIATKIFDFILNLSILSIIYILIFKQSFIYPLLITAVIGFLKVCGEAISLKFYNKHKYIMTANMKIYMSVIIIGLLLSSLLFLKIYIPYNYLYIVFIIALLLAIASYTYIYKYDNYYLTLKQVNTFNAILNSNNDSGYNKQKVSEIRKKDYDIDYKLLKDKKGYDYFNTIFFLRHKSILMNSANNISVIALCFFIILFIVVYIKPDIAGYIYNILNNHISVILLFMYFINRGALITQAMFFNCDVSMLTFNFYRQPDVILNLFKKRLLTIIKVNLRPALIIATGLVITFIISSSTFYLSYLAVFLVVVLLSIFFSIHYLVLYYLLQPYDAKMEMKSITYTIISFLTYFICFMAKDLVVSFFLFSIIVLGLIIIYIIVALLLVYKKAKITFRIK